MTVQQVVDLAKAGELKQVSAKTNNEAVLGYINLGLIELYKRFPLRVEEQVITLVDGVDIYPLPADCMYIVAAYGEVDEGSAELVNVLPINEEDNPLSVNTVSWNKVQVPLAVTGGYVSLIYAAGPDLIQYDALGAYLTADVPLPMQMIEALLHYMGYRAHGSVDGAIQTEAQSHYTRFEASCARIENSGLLTSDDLNMGKRFSTRGFV